MHAQEKLQIGIDWTDDEWECTIQFTDFVNDYYVVNSTHVTSHNVSKKKEFILDKVVGCLQNRASKF